MNTRKLSHPSDPSVVKTVKASDAKSWERAGWVPVKESKSAEKKTTKETATKAAPVLKVNHQHD